MDILACKWRSLVHPHSALLILSYEMAAVHCSGLPWELVIGILPLVREIHYCARNSTGTKGGLLRCLRWSFSGVCVNVNSCTPLWLVCICLCICIYNMYSCMYENIYVYICEIYICVYELIYTSLNLGGSETVYLRLGRNPTYWDLNPAETLLWTLTQVPRTWTLPKTMVPVFTT